MNNYQRKNQKTVESGESIFSSLETPLKDFSNIKIGGHAKYLFAPKTVEELEQIIRWSARKNLEFLPLGGCSNILFGNVANLVLILDKNLPKTLEAEDNFVIVSANYGINFFIEETKKYRLGGLEFLAGIPAHLGGTVFMNAGAFGKNILKFVKWIEIIDSEGKKKKISREKIDFSYRQTSIKGFIIRICFELENKTEAEISSEQKRIIRERQKRHPYDFPSLGSVFKNPPAQFAGKLIEECGLKGKKIGGAQISEKHANFIINRENARFEDVMKLIELCKETVFKMKNIRLEPEIRIINK